MYIILDFFGNTVYKLDFSKYEAFDENGIKTNARFIFDGVDVTKELWDALTNRYLSLKSYLIVWKNIE